MAQKVGEREIYQEHEVGGGRRCRLGLSIFAQSCAVNLRFVVNLSICNELCILFFIAPPLKIRFSVPIRFSKELL